MFFYANVPDIDAMQRLPPVNGYFSNQILNFKPCN